MEVCGVRISIWEPFSNRSLGNSRKLKNCTSELLNKPQMVEPPREPSNEPYLPQQPKEGTMPGGGGPNGHTHRPSNEFHTLYYNWGQNNDTSEHQRIEITTQPCDNIHFTGKPCRLAGDTSVYPDLEKYDYYADQQMGQTDGQSYGSRIHWRSEANGFPYYDRNEPPPRNWQYQNRWEEQRTCNQPLGCHPCYPQRINQNINQREYYHSLSNSQNHYQPRGPHQLYKGCPPFD